MKSLRRRLVLGLALATCLLWAVVGWWRVGVLQGELEAMLDERLVASARMVASIVHQFQPAPVPAPSPDEAALQQQLHSVIARDGVACEVSLVRSEVEVLPIARTGDAPAHSTLGAPGFGTITKGGKTWRTYVLQDGELRVATSDRLDLRAQLARSAMRSLMLTFAVALAGVWLLVWLLVTRCLRPLAQLQHELRQRQPQATEPVRAGQDVRELAPLVASLNALLARARSAIEHERRWTADAAHELRTPLTAIKTQVQVAQMALATPGRDAIAHEALGAALQGIAHMHGTLEQLLQLARVEGAATPEGAHATPAAAIAQALERAVQQSRQRAQHERGSAPAVDVRCQPPAHDAAWQRGHIAVPAALLASAIGDLLDNALRHHAGDGPVECTLALLPGAGGDAPGCAEITLRDHGPGLTEEECVLATQRFWRKGATSSTGSGLGLTIARRIAESGGGTLQLAPTHPGLIARLRWPLQPAG
ncbi:two-component sensor histidine kinase [Pulveribacter suum]|uniref:histidine kinase n=2 Tax=Pulveribacter suum TaxID=2116657 RepID=A0A2P1NPU6_9BURK|nr:two-component sensor histidine kinase [Pulveribacter suum]